MLWLILIILIGFFFWLTNLHILQFSRDWPLIIVLIGIFVVIFSSKRNKRRLIIKKLEKGKISAAEAEQQLIEQNRPSG